jgi:quinol monooxygenase YgiN
MTMIIVHVEFQVDTAKSEEFDRWFVRLAEASRQEQGCHTYDFLRDPAQAERRVVIEVWKTAQDLDFHESAPHHVEMLALASRVYGAHDLRVHRWEADVHAQAERKFFDEPAAGQGVSAGKAGRPHVDELVRQFTDSHQ